MSRGRCAGLLTATSGQLLALANGRPRAKHVPGWLRPAPLNLAGCALLAGRSAENELSVFGQYYALPILSVRSALYRFMLRNETGYKVVWRGGQSGAVCWWEERGSCMWVGLLWCAGQWIGGSTFAPKGCSGAT